MLTKEDLNQIREITREVSSEVSREVSLEVTREVLREELPKAFEIFEIRMDRKMDARFAAQDRWITARFDRLEGEIDGLAQATAAGFARVDDRFVLVDDWLDRIESRLDAAGVPDAADRGGEEGGPWLPPFRPTSGA